MMCTQGQMSSSMWVRVLCSIGMLVCTTLSMFSKEQGACRVPVYLLCDARVTGVMLPATCVVWDLFQSKMSVQALLTALRTR